MTAPTPEQYAERARRADKATKGGMSGLLALEAVVALLVPRAIAFSDGGLGLTKTLILIGLAVLLIVAAGMVRRPFGVGFGSALQLALILSGVLTLAMLVLGLLFAATWLWLLKVRHDLVGTPGGLRVLIS
jgi:hypothetical protein